MLVTRRHGNTGRAETWLGNYSGAVYNIANLRRRIMHSIFLTMIELVRLLV